jgi:2,3-bisphosphoglycerate-independent phosphoglycerate mutase
MEPERLRTGLELRDGLGEIVSDAGLGQLRIAETERYPHVTRFFNGGREEPFPGEERIRVPSPEELPGYDLQPELSAAEVTDRLIDALAGERFSFVLVSYANPDLVAHPGAVPQTLCALLDLPAPPAISGRSPVL